MLGPVVGGSLTERVTWRWIFFINLPTGGLALALIFFNLRLNPHVGSTWTTFFRTFDFAGLFLLVVGIVFLLVGFAQGESQWNDASTITLYAPFAPFAVLMSVTNRRSSSPPLPRLLPLPLGSLLP